MHTTNKYRRHALSIICILIVIFHSCQPPDKEFKDTDNPLNNSSTTDNAPTTNEKVYTGKEIPAINSFPTRTDDTAAAPNTRLPRVNPYNPFPSEVKIGNQIWKTRNLDVDKYRNGESIPQATTNEEWDNLTTGAWCYYNDDPANGAIYGKLYNWYAVNDPRGLAPQGWHVPTDAEWIILVNASGPSPTGQMARAGIYLKEAGTDHWNAPNSADNRTGFTALPGGSRGLPNGNSYPGGTYHPYELIGETGFFWASDVDTPNPLSQTYGRPWSILIKHNTATVSHWPEKKHYGYSVRLIKD